ncbi:GNAT family N-acetyltransferase [Ornithinibacillus contaminans]|uniref:GNAT family N-acetyltransferase n=1 Tax=Ornithinibacillus contaminans TaxID=694055 RepID=UPI00064DA01D|nr:GNAT family N-acetyltransferase [Ornithinibacillus contaminans]
MNCRKATVEDVEQLVEIRKKQLIDEGIEPVITIDTELYHFFDQKLRDGSLVQWIVENNEKIITTGAIVVYDFPPTYTNKNGKKGYITNMFTEQAYRGQGFATKLLTKLVQEAKQRDINKLWLGASTLGRPVYAKFGFIASDEWMELNIT